MGSVAVSKFCSENTLYQQLKTGRIQSVDLLRGIVMIILALDHVTEDFPPGDFVYNPANPAYATAAVYLTSWITHFCAPVFIFLAGIAAYLYGIKNSRETLTFFLLARGIWLMYAELIIETLGRTFDLSYPFFSLQVVWATGISMLALAAIIQMNWRLVLALGILLITAHNLLDNVHVAGSGLPSFLWSLLHEQGCFAFGDFSFLVSYPVLPWIGIITAGYSFGHLYNPSYDPKKRKNVARLTGTGAILLFIILRASDCYGDAVHWALQKNAVFSVLSFLNVTQYPPSLLFILMTLGPALIFLSFAEKPLNKWTSKIATIGRVPVFYYLVHIFLIHLLARAGVIVSGHDWQPARWSSRVNNDATLKGGGFTILKVYLVWITVIIILYPLCKRFDSFKRCYQSTRLWLRYL